jgi:hypothetical protein
MEEISRRKSAISNTILAAAVIIVIAVASGAYIYLTYYSSTAASVRTGTSVDTKIILTGSTSAGFFKNQLVGFGYTQDYTCTPALAKFATNQTEATRAAAKTACEVGGGDNTAVPNAAPVFILIPAYAGLSVFGVPALGATNQGYPVFKNNVIFTQCGAGGSTSGCADHPTLVYSPIFTLVEQHLGIKSGYGGLPEGVLPVPAHDHVVNYEGGNSIPWDVIAVLVFDPNVMPDGQTGQCHQWVTSDLSNPTANCLTSFDTLSKALTTTTTATANANATQNNPIYDTLGGVKTQILIPGVQSVGDNSPANLNLFLYFNVQSKNPFSG